MPLAEQLAHLQRILIGRATGSSWSGASDEALVGRPEYVSLRKSLLVDRTIAPHLPDYLRKCRDLDQFWAFIKYEYRSYAERREFIWDSLAAAIEKAERVPSSPADADISEKLATLSPEAVHAVWEEALRRRDSDPQAAITSARTLIETVCKHILVERGVQFDDGAELPKLYGLTATALTLAPDQHTEKVFKQILGGCNTVVEGLGALRNRLSDAHGLNPVRAKPSGRHAALAVNLAGTVATFLVETWRQRPPAT
jgi:hypothetical protein